MNMVTDNMVADMNMSIAGSPVGQGNAAAGSGSATGRSSTANAMAALGLGFGATPRISPGRTPKGGRSSRKGKGRTPKGGELFFCNVNVTE